jgi:hypothetical protein
MQVIRKQTKWLEGREGTQLRWMDYVELGFRTMGVKNGEQQLWTEQNGHLF